MNSSRAIAAKILAELVKSKGSLTFHLAKYKAREDFSLLQEMCFGSCRWFHLLEFVLGQLVSKPLKNKDSDIKCLLIVGLYQLREMNLPDYAVINETVSASKQLGKPWARSLTNAVLRSYVRDKDQLEASLSNSAISDRLSYPRWLVEKLADQWPDQLEQLLGNGNQRPPMVLRVNLSQLSRDEFLEHCRRADIDASAGSLAATAVYLNTPQSVSAIPGFESGWASVQDEASQLITGLLQLAAGMRVLDACAAPGGKTCQILESEQSLSELVAIDNNSSRMPRIEENLQRLSLQATLHCADASDLAAWWDNKPFDRILLDAPCSATGVIRRHPDIKLLRSPEEVKSLQETQLRLLQSLWPSLDSGGLLLYTTCSILQDENLQTVAAFLQATADAKYEGITADWGVECRNGRQLLTGTQLEPDGFFFSLLRKL